jgi:hypothetical protein
VVAHIGAIQEQDVKVDVEVESRAKALYQPGRAGVTAPVATSLICSPALRIRWVEITRYTMWQLSTGAG